MEVIKIKPLEKPMQHEETRNEKLVRIADALAQLNIDVTPEDHIPDEVACVESVCEVINKVVPFPKETHTYYFLKELERNLLFEEVYKFSDATIIVSATDTGNGTMKGHTGIIGKDGQIINNNSLTGIWGYSYSEKTWNARFKVKGGMPTRLFRFKK